MTLKIYILSYYFVMHGLQLGVSMGATMASSFSAAEETTKFKRRPAHARAAAGATPAAATGSCRWHRRRAPEHKAATPIKCIEPVKGSACVGSSLHRWGLGHENDLTAKRSTDSKGEESVTARK